jgi:hypothetical protein
MKFKLSHSKKIFIIGAIICVILLCIYSIFSYFEEVEISALASPATIKSVAVKLAGSGQCQVGQKYTVSWDSDCRGGEAMVWLSTASSSKNSIGILVPLTSLSADNFGEKDSDARLFFDDCWKFNLSHTGNKGKLSFTMPSALNLSKDLFNSDQGVFYVYTVDGRFALHKIVKEQVMMQVMPANYYLRIDIKGKNGCVATGFSQKIKVDNKEFYSATKAKARR